MKRIGLAFACLLAVAIFTAQTAVLPKTAVFPNTTLLPASAAVPAGKWTALQQKLLTCPALTSPCIITVDTTQAGSALSVYIISGNNITISSVTDTNGADGWALCAASGCHIVNTGNDALDAAESVSGAGGATTITVNLSGSATGFLFVGMAEFAPPTGTTAILDTVGTAQSASCTNNCAPPTLTLSGSNDAIAIYDDTNATLFGCSAGAYQYDCWGAAVIDALNVSTGTPPTVTQSGAGGYATFTSLAFKASGAGTLPSTTPLVNSSHQLARTDVSAAFTCSLPVTSGNLVVLDAGTMAIALPLSNTFSVADGNTRYTWSSHITTPLKSFTNVIVEGWAVIASATETLNVTVTSSTTASAYGACALRQYTIASGAFDQACSTCGTNAPAGAPNTFTVTTSGNLAANNEIVTGCSFQPVQGGNYGYAVSNANSGFNFRPNASILPFMVCQDKVLSGGSGGTTSMSWGYTGAQSTVGIAATLATFQP